MIDEGRLKILTDGAKYDVSCSSSGSRRKNTKDGIGNASVGGICHSFTQDGRCISLLKVLMTNDCIFDCKYCPNRKSADVPRAIVTPEEMCELVMGFYRRNYIEGLFLSSGVLRSPDYTTELMIRALSILRSEYRFNGYIHAKAIPGTSPELVEQLGFLSDRLSVNIELPSAASLGRRSSSFSHASRIAGLMSHNRHFIPFSYLRGTMACRPFFTRTAPIRLRKQALGAHS